MKHKLPAVLGLALVLVGAFVGVLFISKDTNFLPRAAPEYIPQDVRITNPTDSSFTVSWVTQEPAIGFVKVGREASDIATTIVDVRDQLTGSSSQFRTHFVTINGLEPATTYYFRLGSQNDQLYDNDGNAYTYKTAPSLSGNPPSDTAYGIVMTPAQTPALGALVYVSLENAAPLASLVKEDGSWAVNLSQARTPDLNNFINYDYESSQIEILVQDGVASQTLVVTTSNNDQPVPDITLGQSADYSSGSNSNPPPPSNDNTISKFSLIPIVVTDSEVSPIEIITFPQDGVVTNLTRPNIEGISPSSSALTITLQSSPVYTASVQSDGTGRWNWSPPNPLQEGEHTLTVTFTDENGQVHTKTRSFVVASSNTDSLPNYTATPSATISPSAIPTITATPTPDTRSVIPATSSAIPTPGSTLPTLIIIISGLSLLSFGIVLSLRSQ